MNDCFDAMDENIGLIAGEIGKQSIQTHFLTRRVTETTKQIFELNGQESPIHETIDFENLHELWNHVLSQVSHEISKPSFDTWIKSTKSLSYNEKNSTVTIITPNSFAQDWFKDHYSHLIQGILMQLTSKELNIEVIAQKDLAKESN
ncbi:MAG: DnaA N-terminal domain-containing protein [Enterococcus sp.]